MEAGSEWQSQGHQAENTINCTGGGVIEPRIHLTQAAILFWKTGPPLTNAIDLRTLDRHRDAAVTSLIPALSCRSCLPNAPFAELVRLSRTSIADEMWEEHRRRVLGE